MQRHDNNTFFRAVHWAKGNIRKGKDRLSTYKAAERYYGVDGDKIKNYLLKYEHRFMSIDYQKYPNFTVTDHEIQKKSEHLSISYETKETSLRNQYPQDYTIEDINSMELTKFNKLLKENNCNMTKNKPKFHEDPYADM